MSAHHPRRSPNTWRILLLAAGTVAAGFLGTPSAQPRGPDSTLLLPLHITATAANLRTVASGATFVLDIVITRWSTATEREALIGTAIDIGQPALLRALQNMPFHGHMSIPRWVGPDPHNVRLGWDLRYALNTALEDGAQQIDIATDRYIGLWEGRDKLDPIDYPFTVIEIRVDRQGRGSGKIATATRITVDRKKNQIAFESYASEPVRLTNVRIDKPRNGR